MLLPNNEKDGSIKKNDIGLRSITHHDAFTHQLLDVDEEKDTSYDQDYDKDNLHMTPLSITSQDSEDFSVETIRHEDVVAVGKSDTVSYSYYNNVCTQSESSEYIDNDDDEYELEEDWDIAHTISCEGDGSCDVLDNTDDT